MLDRLEDAFCRRQASEDRLRAFIADASHELRTPLASIRGYAELFRMGAVRRGARAVERAMRRIEDEAARMGVLVEDLLTLARLDEVADAPHAELDLAALAGDAVDDARATAPDREISLDADGGAAVLGDAHQLRQVLGNLLRNALVHTPAGTPIEVSVEPRPDVVAPRPCATTAPACPPTTPTRSSSASGAPRAAASAARAARASGWRSSPGSSTPTTAACAPATRDGGGAAFVVELPALRKLSAGSQGAHTRRAEALAMTSTDLAPRMRRAPVRTPTSRSSSRSTTRRPRSSAASAACTASSRDEFPFSWRIVIADNASTDATPEIAARLAARRCPASSCLRLERKGRGRALRAAWSTADARVVAYMDVDLSTDLRGAAAARRAAALRPQRPRDRHAAGARRRASCAGPSAS